MNGVCHKGVYTLLLIHVLHYLSDADSFIHGIYIHSLFCLLVVGLFWHFRKYRSGGESRGRGGDDGV